eukprot:982746-Pleurochrysis_carterae.AAC.6
MSFDVVVLVVPGLCSHSAQRATSPQIEESSAAEVQVFEAAMASAAAAGGGASPLDDAPNKRAHKRERGAKEVLLRRSAVVREASRTRLPHKSWFWSKT